MDAAELRKGQDVSEEALMNNMFGFLDDEGSADGRQTEAFGRCPAYLIPYHQPATVAYT